MTKAMHAVLLTLSDLDIAKHTKPPFTPTPLTAHLFIRVAMRRELLEHGLFHAILLASREAVDDPQAQIVTYLDPHRRHLYPGSEPLVALATLQPPGHWTVMVETASDCPDRLTCTPKD